MSVREIVTLQVGHYANYVGTHFWNLQAAGFSFDSSKPSEVDHDILFREGCTPKGLTTYLPRLVAIDLNASLGSLKKDGDIYSAPAEKHSHEVQTWNGKSQLCKVERTQNNAFQQHLNRDEQLLSPDLIQNDEDKDICLDSTSAMQTTVFHLDESVKTWTDFMVMRVHPRSLHLVNDYALECETDTFGSYQSGYQIMHTGQEVEEIENKLRFFVEECDQLTGFHLLFDSYNGFSGVSSELASYLKDEYANKTLVSVPLFQRGKKPLDGILQSTLLLNTLLSYERMSTISDLVLPMSCQTEPHSAPNKHRTFPLLNYKGDSLYHTSSILAATFDTATLAYRLKTDQGQLSELTGALGNHGRKVAAISSIFPVPLAENASICDVFRNLDPRMTPVTLTPYCNITDGQDLFQSVVLRGLPINLKITDRKDHSDKTLDDLLKTFLCKMVPSRTSCIRKVSEACCVQDPFPNIFDPKVQHLGLLSQTSTRPSTLGVGSVPMLAGIHSNTNLGQTMHHLLTGASSAKLKKALHMFTDAGLEFDEITHVIEGLQQLASCYGTACE